MQTGPTVRLQRFERLLGGLALALTLGPAASAAPLMDWPDLLGRPMPAPTREIAYGALPEQVADLWLPAGRGPFPVVLMAHGGCWRSGVAKLTIMNYAAEDLRRRGIAVWNIEYRGVDRPGGGYPGTFQDVAAATDKLAQVAPAYHLRTDRVVAFATPPAAIWCCGWRRGAAFPPAARCGRPDPSPSPPWSAAAACRTCRRCMSRTSAAPPTSRSWSGPAMRYAPASTPTPRRPSWASEPTSNT
jgi:hypothetical protein